MHFLKERIVDRGLGAVVIAVIAALAIATGCGDDSDGSDGNEAALTKAEYVKQGNAICKKGVNKRTNAVSVASEEDAKENGGKVERSKAEEEELVLEKALPPIREAVEELAELPPPEGDEDTVNAFVEGLEEAVEKTEEDPSSVLAASGSSSIPFEGPKEEASDYGLGECSALA